MADLVRTDPGIVVWWATDVECVSALRRREREGRIDGTGVGASLAVLDRLLAGCSEVLPNSRLRTTSRRLLATHPLRGADACQLAAALNWTMGEPAGTEFVCLDERLAAAAAREGFQIIA